MQEEFRILHEKYPRLVPETTYFEHGPGWVGLLDKYFAEVDATLPADIPWRNAQIKQKFGTLRLYCEPVWPDRKPTVLFEIAIINAGQQFVHEGHGNELDEKLTWAKRLAEARSAHVCEECGKPGRLVVSGYYYHTACEDHADNGKPVEGEAVLTAGGKKYRYDPKLDEIVPVSD